MRIDARTPGYSGTYAVFDVPACKEVPCVVWIDTDTAEFGVYEKAGFITWDLQVHKRKKIELAGNTFLLDPIEDSDGDEQENVLRLPAPAMTVRISTTRECA